MKNIILKIFNNKIASNASWIISGRIVQMLISLIISMFTARYLGPSNYGLINYAAAYVAFFTSFSTLGLNAIIVKEYVENPKQEGLITGTTLVMRLCSSLVSIVAILAIVMLADYGEQTTIWVVTLYSIQVIFSAFDTFNFWFQSKLNSKYVSIASTIAIILVSLYKVYLLIEEKSIYWFALSNSLDFAIIAVILFYIYKKNNGPKVTFSIVKAKSLLFQSYHFILSGLMVAVYGYTDKIMIKHMIDVHEVGLYSTATAICGMWVFVLNAIIDSMRPSIIQARKDSIERYESRLTMLYSIVFYVSIFVSVVFLLLGRYVILVLYGEAYLGALPYLQIVTWYTAFSYLGVARNIWIVCEKKQYYLKYMYFWAAILNVSLNYFLISYIGGYGAAIASLITEIFTCILIPVFFVDLRRNNKLIFDAILLKKCINYKN